MMLSLVVVVLVVTGSTYAAPTETIVVDLKLQTGGALSGPVVAHSEHGLVIAHDQTPYVFAWNELKPENAFVTRQALIEFDRGGAEKLTAKDHHDLGVFALWHGRLRLARGPFARARALDKTYDKRGREAIQAFYRRRRNTEEDPHPLRDGQESTAAFRIADGDAGGASAATFAPMEVTAEPSPQQREAVREVYERFGAKVQEVMGKGVALVESDHFLVWTDWPTNERDQLVGWLNAMYLALCGQFGLDPDEDIFLAKCPVYAWRSKDQFQRFARYFDGYDGVNAIGYTRSIADNGHVHVVLARQGRSGANLDRVACTLVHEGTHAFLHRLFATRLIPHWVNEGYADLMSERVLGDRCPAGENAELLARQYAEHEWPIGDMLRSVGSLPVHQYAIAHSVVAFLDALDRERFAAFLRDLKTGKAVGDALNERYSGMTIAGLEEQWRAAVLKVDPGN